MAIRAVAENISDETDPVVVEPMKRVFSVIERVLKFNRGVGGNPKLFQAAIECISSCSGMIHLYDTVLKSIIGFILEGLFQPEVMTSAALALKTLSRDCSRSLAPFTPDILSFCKQALESGRMSPNDSIRIVFCIGRFLPFLPSDQIITAVNEIFAPCLTQLQSLAAQDPQSEIKHNLLGILNIFGTLCASLDGTSSGDDDDDDDEEISEDMLSSASNNNNNSSHATAQQRAVAQIQNRAQPLIPVVEQILPALVPVAEKWAKDEEVMEALFSIPKHTLATIHSSSPTVIHYSMQLVVISFRLNPLMCATCLAKQTMLMLGKDEMTTQCQFLAEIHQLVADRVKENRDTDFTESYLQLIAQLVRSNVNMVNSAGIRLESIIQFSTVALTCMESSVLKAAIFLLTIVLQKSSELRPPLVDYFKANGLALMRQIILAIGHVIPRSNCHNFSELLLALNKAFTAEWRVWLSEILAVEGFPSVHANAESKQKFFMKVTKERVNKRAIQDAINEFTVVCRNMAGSEYAAATSKRI
ncbi:Importin-13 [Orchesella cincta]|uniref:Importin-13 n=1 Tax=Orchesella cincta TaxID=48709 RepID=A0A1D2MPY9_ORCCI|nr:Importin-13 [Orchesella cincta]